MDKTDTMHPPYGSTQFGPHSSDERFGEPVKVLVLVEEIKEFPAIDMFKNETMV